MQKEFRIAKSKRRGLLLSGIFGIIFGVFAIPYALNACLVMPRLALSWVLLLVAIGGPLSGCLNLALRSITLALSPEEVVYRAPGLELRTTWGNVERIEHSPALFRRRGYENLILRKPATRKAAWWTNILWQQSDQEIPLSLFGNWRKEELGAVMQEYAPRLFKDK